MAMSMQEIFDKVYVHLLTQNAKSLHKLVPGTPPSCAYRGDNGTMCAVGCLISDEAYTPSIEGFGVRGTVVSRVLRRLDVLPLVRYGEELKFLAELQGIHDVTDVTTWDGGLRRLANLHGLTVPVLP